MTCSVVLLQVLLFGNNLENWPILMNYDIYIYIILLLLLLLQLCNYIRTSRYYSIIMTLLAVKCNHFNLLIFIQMLGITEKGEIIMRSSHWNIKNCSWQKMCVHYLLKPGIQVWSGVAAACRCWALLVFLTAYVLRQSCQVSPFLSAEPQERASLTWPTAVWRTVTWLQPALPGQIPAAGLLKKTSLSGQRHSSTPGHPHLPDPFLFPLSLVSVCV